MVRLQSLKRLGLMLATTPGLTSSPTPRRVKNWENEKSKAKLFRNQVIPSEYRRPMAQYFMKFGYKSKQETRAMSEYQRGLVFSFVI